jgi:hypothetical protein
LVEHDLAKVGVASSSLVSRSSFQQNLGLPGFCFLKRTSILYSRGSAHWPGGRVVMQRPAKPRTPVRFRPWPPMRRSRKAPVGRFFFMCLQRGARRLYKSHAGLFVRRKGHHFLFLAEDLQPIGRRTYQGWKIGRYGGLAASPVTRTLGNRAGAKEKNGVIHALAFNGGPGLANGASAWLSHELVH